MNWLELIAAVLGFVSVLLLVWRNVWAFPIGIVMVILYVFIFYQARFYSDMCLQFVYVAMQIQGWYEWTRSDHRQADKRIVVLSMNRRQWAWSAGIQVAGTLLLGFAMARLTNASLPYIDAFTTVMSLLAQWWMNKRYVENWWIWIVVDVIYLYQYSYKELYLTTALYAAFLGLAVYGLLEGRKKSGQATSGPAR